MTEGVNRPFAMYTLKNGLMVRYSCRHSVHVSCGHSFHFVDHNGKFAGYPGEGFYANNVNAVIDHAQRELNDQLSRLQKEIYDTMTKINDLENHRE